MITQAPDINIVETIAKIHIDNIARVERVAEGVSTFVYRIKTRDQTFYMRFLPEDWADFEPEVIVLNTLYDKGVKVPNVIFWESKNPDVGMSMMLCSEIPGDSVNNNRPNANDLHQILFDAGKQSALIHTVPVDGFSWIERNIKGRLAGEKKTFDGYFMQHLEESLQVMEQNHFSDSDKTLITDLMKKARKALNIENAVLVHGDFDETHIFHLNGQYTGIIDFGEIRGNNRLFDLALFVAFNPKDFKYLVKGYNEIYPLSSDDLYNTELMALFYLVHKFAKKVDTPKKDFWLELVNKQLNRIKSYPAI
ncbi:MAG: aminoglycoside phosphotransferase family protein [Alphaproteobacteria bacterium]|nr:aminoglycoside phosphotransferase family protein [Alphaproteobacteria bacterium]